jgi:cytochrome c-type biogenesis protein CcmE
MRRKNKLIISAVGITVLLGVFGTATMSASTEFVSPTKLDSGDYAGEWVNLEGVAHDVETDEQTVRFTVTDQNASMPVVYNGTVPETMGEGRIVVAKGVVRDGNLVAKKLSVRAHEGGNNSEQANERPRPE